MARQISTELASRASAAAAVPTEAGWMRSRPLRLLVRDWRAVLGMAIVLVSLLLAVAVPTLRITDPLAADSAHQLAPPFTGGHLLGTDQAGRDLFSRLLWGVQPAIVQGALSVLTAAAIGFVLGGAAGFRGGPLGFVVMRLVDSVLAIPPVMMAIAVAASLSPGLENAVIAMTLVMVAPMARVARGAVVHVMNREYVVAARALGASEWRILWRHVMRNAVSPVLAYAVPLVGIMIVFASGLSFIGLGVQPPAPDWGRMVNEGRTVLATSPHIATFAGLAIFVVGLGFNLVGDWLGDVLDPRSGSGR